MGDSNPAWMFGQTSDNQEVSVLRYGRLYLFILSAAALGVAAVAGTAQAPDPEAYQQ